MGASLAQARPPALRRVETYRQQSGGQQAYQPNPYPRPNGLFRYPPDTGSERQLFPSFLLGLAAMPVDAPRTTEGEDWTYAARPGDCRARLLRRRGPAKLVIAPAGNGPAGLHPTAVVRPGADRGEGAPRRRGLAFVVPSPADYGPVGPHSAGVASSGADRGEGTSGRRGLARVITAPAFEGTAGPHSAGVASTGADRDEGTPGRRGLAIRSHRPSRRWPRRSALRRCGNDRR